MRFIIGSVLIIFCSLTLSAQSTWKVGILFGISKSYLNGTVATDCPCVDVGSTNTSKLGFIGGVSLYHSLSSAVDVALNVGYSNTGEVTSTAFANDYPIVIVKDTSQSVGVLKAKYSLYMSAQYATIRLAGRIKFFDNMHVQLGVETDVHIASASTRKYTLISVVDDNGNPVSKVTLPKDSTQKYEDDGRTVVVAEQAPMSNATPLLVSIMVGIDYDIKLSDGISIAPYVTLNTPLHSIRKDASYKMMSYSFGIQTLFDL